MSSFNCEWCNEPILDKLGGDYYTFCKHYPNKQMSNTQWTVHKQWLDSLPKFKAKSSQAGFNSSLK